MAETTTQPAPERLIDALRRDNAAGYRPTWRNRAAMVGMTQDEASVHLVRLIEEGRIRQRRSGVGLVLEVRASERASS